jgi:hypothetical protein
MNIKKSIYDHLNPSQRVSAMLEALNRHDRAEAERLMEGVERKVYEQPDAAFTDDLISKIMTDNAIDDKVGAYRALLGFVNRKEINRSGTTQLPNEDNIREILARSHEAVRRAKSF